MYFSSNWFIVICSIGLGFICCLLRILFCICPSHCISTSRNISKNKKVAGISAGLADHTTALLHGECKRVSIASNFGPQVGTITIHYMAHQLNQLNSIIHYISFSLLTTIYLISSSRIVGLHFRIKIQIVKC